MYSFKSCSLLAFVWPEVRLPCWVPDHPHCCSPQPAGSYRHHSPADRHFFAEIYSVTSWKLLYVFCYTLFLTSSATHINPPLNSQNAVRSLSSLCVSYFVQNSMIKMLLWCWKYVRAYTRIIVVIIWSSNPKRVVQFPGGNHVWSSKWEVGSNSLEQELFISMAICNIF